MEFDKNKILTVVTADQAKVGQKGWFSNHPNLLKAYVGQNNPDTLRELDVCSGSPFYDGYNYYILFYPAPEPTYAERQAEWVKENGLKVGDKVRIIQPWDYRENGFSCSYTGFKDGVFTVKEIRDFYIYAEHDRKGLLWCLPYFAIEVIKEPTYRPYNNDELNDLVGEILTNKQSGRRKLVTGKPTASEGVNLDGNYINAKDLLASFYRNTDEPCGVKE